MECMRYINMKKKWLYKYNNKDYSIKGSEKWW